MKKILSVLLTAVLVFALASSALADITVSGLKVEIDSALKEYAAAYDAKNGTKTKIETVGGGADYSGSLKPPCKAAICPTSSLSKAWAAMKFGRTTSSM